MSGSIHLSLTAKYCKVEYDDGLCVNYSSLNGEDANRTALNVRREKIMKFLQRKIKTNEYIFIEMVKGGISIMNFVENSSGHVLNIKVSDYVKTYRNVNVQIMVNNPDFNEIILERVKPFLLDLIE